MTSNRSLSRILISVLFIASTLGFVSTASAWGKRGHEMVGSLAAQLLANQHPQGKFLMAHTYDMGFYNNVPDLVWKADDEIYKREFYHHYIDFEIFQKAFAEKKSPNAWVADRQKFFSRFPNIESRSGRNFWRVHELNARLEGFTKQLKAKKIDNSVQRSLQGQWLTTAGVMGHYVADLAQPLHVSENHDGQLTEQKGLHHWFEEDVIDDLYPHLHAEVLKRAGERWPEFTKKAKGKSAFDLAVELGKNSSAAVPEVLAIDKRVGRESAFKVSPEYKELATERLTLGVLYLAQIWSQQLGWNYDGKKFYYFDTRPAYIEPQPERKP